MPLPPILKGGFEVSWGGKKNVQLQTANTGDGSHAGQEDTQSGVVGAVYAAVVVAAVVRVVAGVGLHVGCDLGGHQGEGGQPHDDQEDVERQDSPVVVQVGGTELGDDEVDTADHGCDTLFSVRVSRGRETGRGINRW